MTTGERHRRVEELFHAALARGAGERAEFLARACANDSPLRAEVERLLSADASAGTFLETPAGLDSDPRLAETEVGPEPQARIRPGETLNGRWLVGEELARGGIGAVYLACDIRLLNKAVVVKTLLDESLQNEWKVKKFKHEMEALTRVEHRGVVGVLDAGRTPDGTPFLVMQYVGGVNLSNIIGPGGIELRRAARLIRQMGEALHAAHEAGVIHRDLKPGNVMVRRAGGGDEEVKLIDFGIAKVINPKVTTATATSLIVGSLAYMAPEQLRAEPLGPASDIYALGVIAYEMVTGRKPFEPASPYELLETQRAGVGVPPRDLRPDLPEAAQALILRALSFLREERPQNAREFGEALALALDGATTGGTERPARPEGKHETVAAHAPAGAGARVGGRRVLALIAALLLALVAGALLFRQSRSQGTPARQETVARRTLSYWIVVQKYRDGNPYKDAFRLPKEILFEEDDRLRLGVMSPEPGYLYIVNEGPLSAGGRPDYNLLFPTPSANNGAALLTPGQPVTIPEEGRKPFRLDAQQGTEKLWLVYSAQSVAELEAVKGVVNAPRHPGEISDPGQAAAVQQFLRTHAASPPQVKNDAANRQTHVSVPGDVLVHLVSLEHH